jgi:hypothetical protein
MTLSTLAVAMRVLPGVDLDGVLDDATMRPIPARANANIRAATPRMCFGARLRKVRGATTTPTRGNEA